MNRGQARVGDVVRYRHGIGEAPGLHSLDGRVGRVVRIHKEQRPRGIRMARDYDILSLEGLDPNLRIRRQVWVYSCIPATEEDWIEQRAIDELKR